MQTFREWLNEKEGKETYKDFFNKKLEKYGVKSATELTGEDEKKFFDEVDAEWEGEDEEPEAGDVNESLDKELLKKLATVETIIKIGIDDKSIKKYQIDKCITILQSINNIK